MPEQPNIIFLYGNDEYAISRRLTEFESVFDDASAREMNTARLDARTMAEDDLNNAVNSMPFLAKQRLVLLANPSARYVAARSGDQPQAERQAEGRKRFLEFLERVPPTTRLVIWEEVDIKPLPGKEDEKHWLVKWFRKAGLKLERFSLPYQHKMQDWIIKNARAQGGEIAPAGAERLAQLVGTDTRQAAQELTKLLTYANWNRPVTRADVDALSPLTAEPDIFGMVDALANGKGGEAQRMLQRLLEHQDAFSTWGMIIRQFRLLLLAREVIDRAGSLHDAEAVLGVHPYVAEKAFKQARGFTLPALEQIYHKLLEIDEGAKTGRMSLELSMQLLVAELSR
jgi:DNA polymerase-3 subunit delta